MKKLKLISKSGMFFALALILLVAVIDASFPSDKNISLGKATIDFSTISDILFISSVVMLVTSVFLRTLTYEKEWKGLVLFSKRFLPIALVFYALAVFLTDKNDYVFGGPQYVIGIALGLMYVLGMLYFSLKTFYQKW